MALPPSAKALAFGGLTGGAPVGIDRPVGTTYSSLHNGKPAGGFQVGPSEHRSGQQPDGLSDLYTMIEDVLASSSPHGASAASRLAYAITDRVAAALTVSRSDIPHPALVTDLERVLSDVLDDPEVTAAPQAQQAGLIAVSVLAALEPKWTFHLRHDWLAAKAKQGGPETGAADASRSPSSSAAPEPPALL